MLLYYITDRKQFPGDENARRATVLRKIAEAARCGVNFIQLREKDLSGRELEKLANEASSIVAEISRSRGRYGGVSTRLLINSRTDIAIACGAHGVHLPTDDASAREVRALWTSGETANFRKVGPPLITLSCHSVADVARAAVEGADYAVLAPVFEKKDSSDSRPIGLDTLRQASRESIPVLALGGITMENGRFCFEAGAKGIAAIRLFQENNIADIVRVL